MATYPTGNSSRLALAEKISNSPAVLTISCRYGDPPMRVTREQRPHKQRPGLAIVKLGGSLAASPYLTAWLAAIAAEAGAIVVVPGGGPFADAVRAAQPAMRFDNAAAHEMALLAMTQFGRALESLNPAVRLASSLGAIRRTMREGMVPAWSPERIARAAGLPQSWDLTSDSLAAWLAAALGARHLVLVKHGHFAAEGAQPRVLVERGVVDPLFPYFIKDKTFRVLFATPDDSARLSEGLRRKLFPEIVPADEAIVNRVPASK
jgi:5-(aminomethyl)-3-furanmethanol phosphate kinase